MADPLRFERELWDNGVLYVAGVDEAGIGPLAGPVVAAAVILPQGLTIPGVDDSKKLSPIQRESAAERIRANCVAWAVGWAEVGEIDRLNIYHAGLLAMRRALSTLSVCPGHALVDGREIPDCPIPQTRLIKGDSLSQCIAAASILAKTTRDRIMSELDCIYPEYGFAAHKGYPTAAHRQSLATHGPCPAHRSSFQAVAEFSGQFSPRFSVLRDQVGKAESPKEIEAILSEALQTSSPLCRSELARLRSICGRRKQMFSKRRNSSEQEHRTED